MPFTVTKGYSFAAGGTVNAAHLHALIESATLANGNRDSIDRTRVCPIYYAATAPTSPTDGELWLNSVSGAMVAWKAASSIWVPTGPQQQRQTVAAGTPDIAAGQAVKAVAGFYVALADGGEGSENVIGIAAHGAVAGASLVYVTHGLVSASVVGTISPGNRVQLSATAGSLEDAGTNAVGHVCCGTAMMADSGGYAWSSLKR